jgi:glycosyltransferase involved in cell wall biosynthesis
MRIAYVTLYLAKYHIEGGVGEKIGTHKRIWEDLGNEVRLFFLSPEDLTFEGSRSFHYGASTQSAVLKFITRFFSRTLALLRLIRAIKEYQPDLIYFRQSLYIFPLHRIFDLAPVVFELNANDVSEINLRGWMVGWFHRLTRRISFRKAAGFIYTSHELAESPDNAGYGQPSRVIGNGIDLERNQPLPSPQNSTPVITIAGTPGMIWHGVDKLIDLAERYPDLIINIIGYRHNDIDNPAPPNVYFWGVLPREQVREILKTSDIACGTLALHRKNMQEASPLKVRESAAYGVPLILGYRDTDLTGVDAEHILQIPNTEDNVISHAGQIRSFAYRMMGKRLDRDRVKMHIDQHLKETARIQLFQEVIQQWSMHR